tara:strand:+ start:6519 stop:6746 length:228 start_codon:yes stop_codon:yes gene_type:complete
MTKDSVKGEVMSYGKWVIECPTCEQRTDIPDGDRAKANITECPSCLIDLTQVGRTFIPDKEMFLAGMAALIDDDL